MNILMVRIGRLGDMVMILPALLALKSKHPNATFYVLTSPDGMRLLKTIDSIRPAHVWCIRHTFLHGLIDLIKVKRLLKTHTFDEIYCFDLKKRFIDLLPEHSHILTPMKKLEHYAQRCLQLVGATWQPSTYLNTQAQAMHHVTEALTKAGITSNTILIGFHPSYSGYRRWGSKKGAIHRLWPAEHFVALSRLFQTMARKTGLDIKVVMELLPQEHHLGEKMVRDSQHAIQLIQVSSNFQAYLALIQRFQLLITTNTGVMHLAAGLNTPMVALFSELHPEDCGPFMPKHRYQVLRAEETERPELGLDSISPQAVYESACHLLGYKTSDHSVPSP